MRRDGHSNEARLLRKSRFVYRTGGCGGLFITLWGADCSRTGACRRGLRHRSSVSSRYRRCFPAIPASTRAAPPACAPASPCAAEWFLRPAGTGQGNPSTGDYNRIIAWRRGRRLTSALGGNSPGIYGQKGKPGRIFRGCLRFAGGMSIWAKSEMSLWRLWIKTKKIVLG